MDAADQEGTRKGILGFFGLAYGLTWLCWVPVALSGQQGTASFWIIPYMLGGFGPMAAGFIMAFHLHGREGMRDLWRRMFDFRRISLRWFAFILLIFPILFATNILLALLLNEPMPGFQALRAVIANPLSLVGLLIVGVVAGALSEEPGWRGFALDQLQKKWSAFTSSLVLGLVWWGWHIPLFFVRGTPQYAWGFGTPRFWLFLVGAFPLSMLLTWVYNHNDRSVLAAILLHFAYNFTVGLVYPYSVTFALLHAALLILAAIAVLLATPYRGGATPASLSE